MRIENIRWEIEPTCNLNCKHCFVGGLQNKYPGRIDFYKETLIIDNLYKHGLREIYFTTREPLLHPNIIKLLSYCTKLGIKTTLITNGIYLRDQKLASSLIESGLNSISVSLEGPTAESSDVIRGKGNFNKAIQGVNELVKQMYRWERFFPINLQMTINCYNSSVASEIPKYVNALPFDSLSVGCISETGNATRNSEIILNNADYFALFTEIAAAYQKISHPNYVLIFKSLMPWESILLSYLTDYDAYPHAPNCSIPAGTFSLLSNGYIASCISVYEHGKSSSIDASDCEQLALLDTVFENEVDAYKLRNEELIKSHCESCYFENQCFLCPALAKNDDMAVSTINRCKDARKKVYSYLSRKNSTGTVFELYNTHAIFTYNHLILQKTFSDGMRKEKRYILSQEDLHIFQQIVKKQYMSEFDSFESESEFIKSLFCEGFLRKKRSGKNGYD